MPDQVSLRDVVTSDLEAFFQHQKDPVAYQAAEFTPRERDDFYSHWNNKILGNESVIKRTILAESTIVGNILCFEEGGETKKQLIGYWIDRAFWGRGIATQAVSQFVDQIASRPLYAYVAKNNTGSVRVLEKCGFVQVADESPALLPDEAIVELLFVLDG